MLKIIETVHGHDLIPVKEEPNRTYLSKSPETVSQWCSLKYNHALKSHPSMRMHMNYKLHMNYKFIVD